MILNGITLIHDNIQVFYTFLIYYIFIIIIKATLQYLLNV